mmetsp:Transcript_3126/g.4809  ORF Transcript_3126/g.4809 Transcript_3126/m.4809 type:complete len:273 (+) Transcript_3126:106-924(+)
MPSRKKAKGKGRKAAKEAKAKESQAAVAANDSNRQEESLEVRLRLRVRAQMLGLQISRGSSMECSHGLDDTLPICNEFIETFIPAFLSVSKGSVDDAFEAGHAATALEKFNDVYSSKLESIVSILSAIGTDSFLGEDNGSTRVHAALACHFEELLAVSVRQTQAHINWTKIVELLHCGVDEHTLVKFFRKRIPCHCLDEKYKAVKSVKKMGYCRNVNCSLPGRKVERSKMLCCTGCGDANYCSIGCQRADWKSHRKYCGNIAEEKAAFKKQS